MQSNADVVLAVIRAVEERDREALFELYHNDVELHDAPSLPYGHTARGKAAMREQLEASPEQTWLGTWGFVAADRAGAADGPQGPRERGR